MLRRIESVGDRAIGFGMSGKLHDDDYDRFVTMVERAIITERRTRLLLHFEDFYGWNPHALWDDVTFEASHSQDVERVALVGERDWQEWMDKVRAPFTRADVRYFSVTDLEAATGWVNEPAV
jgi:hypothetical protein